MSNKNEDAKIWKAVGVMAVIAVVGYYAYNSWQETIDAQVQEQQKADAIEQHNQLMQLRSLGYTTKEDFKNSFGDYTGSLYTAWGMTDGDYMYIETDRYNVPQSVCFYSTPRDNGKIMSYAPEFKTISVDMKIDGGETLSFAAKGNNGSERLCLLSPTRFLRNIQDASNLKIALPYINHYDIVDEVKEWNVSQIGVKFK
uniref:Phage protein n=1 Tax=Klebsiella phage K14-2 TaxID=3156075 RepID=A0AB39C9I0_9VIRU